MRTCIFFQGLKAGPSRARLTCFNLDFSQCERGLKLEGRQMVLGRLRQSLPQTHHRLTPITLFVGGCPYLSRGNANLDLNPEPKRRIVICRARATARAIDPVAFAKSPCASWISDSHLGFGLSVNHLLRPELVSSAASISLAVGRPAFFKR